MSCQKVKSYVLGRGTTVLNNCTGAYTNEEKTVIVAVVDRQQAVFLKHRIKEIDNKAFTIIGTSSDIIGDGFKII